VSSRSYVLAALPSPALPFVEKALGGYVELVPARSYDDAVRQLRASENIGLVICGAFFDESRMFDLLQWVRHQRPSVAFVCCRILPTEIPKVSVVALKIACNALGADFIDLPALEQQYGVEGVEAEFRSRVLANMRPTER
jgi:hypothetical protein